MMLTKAVKKKHAARNSEFTNHANVHSWAFVRSRVTPPASRERPPPAAVAESGKLSVSDDTLAAGPIVAVHFAASAMPAKERILHSEEMGAGWAASCRPAL